MSPCPQRDAGVAASTPSWSAVELPASAYTVVADAASTCSSVAGRQPLPDSKVVEIVAGTKIKNHDFGLVPL